MAWAMPIATAKITSPTASSNATMGRSRLVTGPLALNWRTTIRVAAGAVAEAIAPRTIAAGRGRTPLPTARLRAVRAPPVTREAATA